MILSLLDFGAIALLIYFLWSSKKTIMICLGILIIIYLVLKIINANEAKFQFHRNFGKKKKLDDGEYEFPIYNYQQIEY